MTDLAPRHPLAPVTEVEIQAVRAALDHHELLSEETRFVYVGLEEPAKAQVLAWNADESATRRFRALLLDVRTQVSRDVLVDLPPVPWFPRSPSTRRPPATCPSWTRSSSSSSSS